VICCIRQMLIIDFVLISFAWAGLCGSALCADMKPWAETFYNSPAWKQTRRAYSKSVVHLCERCGRPGVIVHHKIPLTPENVTDPDITLNWKNLQLLCRDCHAQVHKPEKRYKVDELGRVITWDD